MKTEDQWIRTVELTLSPPSLKDNTADVDRLVKGLKRSLHADDVIIDFSLVGDIPSHLRETGYAVRAVLYQWHGLWYLLRLQPDGEAQPIFGLAVDLGSSTVVVRLVDLTKGKQVQESSFTNPQVAVGADILTRIHFASHGDGRRELQSMLIQRLNQEIRSLCETEGMESDMVVGMAAAGNTTMSHFFLGLDPYWICREPYIPAINRPGLLVASELGIQIHPRAPVMVFPNVGSYFGGDLIAGILASGMHRREEVSILVDVGTNAEVVLGNRDWLMACAGAAGPALEGGVAGMGMMAGPGVIDQVTVDPETGQVDIRTIGGRPPVGICGSGLIDLVSQLFLAGMIDIRGKFVPEACGHALREEDGIREFIVVKAEDSGTEEDLGLSQPDIDALIRSKAAMFTILTTITRMAGIDMKELGTFYVAGTFGSYIDPRAAVVLGMIPDLPLETYISLGNASLHGATTALLSRTALKDMERIRDRITYIELNVNQEFMNRFSAAKFIPHTDRSLFPSVRVFR